MCPDIANKKDFSCQIRPFLYREQLWSVFKAMEYPCCTPEIREEEAGHWCFCHTDKRIRCGKEAMVALLSKEALGMGSIYGVECTNNPQLLQSLHFCRFVMTILPFLYKLTMCWFSPLVQPRHGFVHSAVS